MEWGVVILVLPMYFILIWTVDGRLKQVREELEKLNQTAKLLCETSNLTEREVNEMTTPVKRCSEGLSTMAIQLQLHSTTDFAHIMQDIVKKVEGLTKLIGDVGWSKTSIIKELRELNRTVDTLKTVTEYKDYRGSS